MKKALLFVLLLAAPASAQPVYNASGEQRNVCKVWDGTDTADVTAAGRVLVDGSGVTQPVSGTVTVTDGSGALNTIVDSGTLTCNAGSGTFTVGDGSGALNVIVDSGTMAATQSGTWTVQPGNTANTTPWLLSLNEGSVTADILDLTNNNPLTVAILDGAGSQITSFGGGTQYTEADTDASITGTVVMWEDTSDTLRAASAAKPLPVNIISGPAGGDGKILDGTATDQADVEAAALASSTLEGLVVRPYPPGDGTLTSTIRDTGSADSLNVAIVDGSGNQITSFGGGTQYAEDTVAAAAEQITMAGVVRDDTPASLVDADGDRTELQVDGTGRLWVNGSGVTQPVSGTVTANAGTNLNTSALALDATLTGRLPAGASPADNESNTNTSLSRMGFFGFAFDGTAWDRIRGDSTDGLLVNLGANNDVTVTGTVTANAGTGNFNVVGTKSNNGGTPGSTNLGTLPAVANASAPTHTETNQVALRTQLDGDLVTVIEDELPAGTQNIGDVDVLTLPSVTIGTFPDNEPFNLNQVAGSAVATGNGTAAGSIRVSVASDSTGQVAVASLPNEGQQTAANSISVTPDTDNDSIGATAAAVPGEATLIAGTDGTNVTVPYIDPCQREARSVYRVDIVTATTTEIAAAVASEFYWICSINLVTAAANNVIIVEDDTATNCPSPTAGVSSGGTTAGEGWNFAANGGIVVGTGSDWVMKTGTANRSFCIITSAATQLSGTITYVSAP